MALLQEFAKVEPDAQNALLGVSSSRASPPRARRTAGLGRRNQRRPGDGQRLAAADRPLIRRLSRSRERASKIATTSSVGFAHERERVFSRRRLTPAPAFFMKGRPSFRSEPPLDEETVRGDEIEAARPLPARASGRDAEFRRASSTFPRFGVDRAYPDVATLKSRKQRYTYGTHARRRRTALADAWSDISGAAGTVLVPSGLAAIAVGADDRARRRRSSPDDGRGLFSGAQFRRQRAEADGRRDDLLRSRDRRRRRRSAAPNTKAVFTEAPGSQSFDMQDIPAISAAAHGARRLRGHGQHLGDAAVLPPQRAAWTSRRGRHEYLPAIPICCWGSSRPTPSGSRAEAIRRPVRDPAGNRRTSFSRCADCARWTCACARRNGRGSPWRAGCRGAPRCCASCIPPWPMIPDTRSGSATSPARRASSA